MRWSLSKHKTFNRCERQWYYKTILGHHAVKEGIRREAYILGSLQSLDSWKGNIVDKIISEDIIPSIKDRKLIDRAGLITRAGELLKKQFDFAIQKKYREKGIPKTGNDEFLALYNVEYSEPIEIEEKRRIWEEIKLSINNFMDNKELLLSLRQASSLIPQAHLTYKYNGFSIEGIPDLLAFYRDRPPHIFDWKAHHFGKNDASTQLNLYSICLMNAEAYQNSTKRFDITDIRLTEFQLVTNVVRDYHINRDSIENTKELISNSLINMAYLKDADKKSDQLDVNDFATTSYETNCNSCSFKKLCWNEKCN